MTVQVAAQEGTEFHTSVIDESPDGPREAVLIDQRVGGLAHVAVVSAGNVLFDTRDYTHLEPGVSPMSSDTVRATLAPLLRRVRYPGGDFVFPLPAID